MSIEQEKMGKKYGKAWMFYILVVSLVLATAFFEVRTMMRDYNNNQAQMLTGLMASSINLSFDNTVGKIEDAVRIIGYGEDKSYDQVYEELKQYITRSPFCGVGLLANDNSFHGEPSDRQDISRNDYIYQVQKSDDIFITDPYRSRRSAENIVTIYVPFFSNGVRRGTVFAHLSLEKIQEFAQIEGIGTAGNVYLTNVYSLNRIACLESELASPGEWSNLMIWQEDVNFETENSYDEYLQQMRDGVEGQSLNYKIGNVEYTQSCADVKNMPGWFVVVEQSREELSGSIDMLRDRLLTYAAVVLFGTMIFVLVLLYLESKQKKRYAELSMRDRMTGLYNNKGFEQMVREYMIKNNNGTALIFIDVDDFKDYNDQYGHLNGDMVLKKFAKEMLDIFADVGYVGRYGGDEFVIFIKNEMDTELIEQRMYELRKRLQTIELEEYGIVEMSFSAGGSRCPKDANSYEELCKTADEAVYRVKKDGKGKFYWHQK